MSFEASSACATDRTQLVDTVIEGYIAWRAETAAVTATYQEWTSAPRDGRASAFVAYSTALDREEYAAAAYQRLIQQAASLAPRR